MRMAPPAAITGPIALATALTAASLAGGGSIGLTRTTAQGRTVPARTVPAGTVAIRPDESPFSAPPTTAQCEAKYKIACYSANQIETAYGLPTLYGENVTGAGQTIAIVDPFGSPTIAHDLAMFDKAFKLPAPPSLKIIQPAGKVPPYNPKNPGRIGAAIETTLDVQYAHTVAPQAKILLVETPKSETFGAAGFKAIVRAEEYVICHHLAG